jgi:hypothetical protein
MEIKEDVITLDSSVMSVVRQRRPQIRWLMVYQNNEPTNAAVTNTVILSTSLIGAVSTNVHAATTAATFHNNPLDWVIVTEK